VKRAAEPGPLASSVVRPTCACLVGPLIWSLHFGLAYAVHHLSCRASADPGSFMTPFAIGAAALAMTALGIAALWPRALIESRCGSIEPSLRAFLIAVMRWLILLSAFGVLWTSGAFLLVRACTS
jgi:hypothetical protein